MFEDYLSVVKNLNMQRNTLLPRKILSIHVRHDVTNCIRDHISHLRSIPPRVDESEWPVPSAISPEIFQLLTLTLSSKFSITFNVQSGAGGAAILLGIEYKCYETDHNHTRHIIALILPKG